MTNNTNNQTITLIGGGLAGCFLAILLANRGYKVTLFEKLSKKEISDTNTKRSYNITFLAYGIAMLKHANLWEMLEPHLHPLKGVSTQLSKNSQPIFTPTYDKKNQYVAVSRASLLHLMLERLASSPTVTLHFETTLLSIDRHEKKLYVWNSKSQKIDSHACDVIIGADGANSLVRPFLQQGQNTQHSQEYASGGYKQFTISTEQINQMQLQSGIAYTWSAPGKFILAFPNHDGSLASLLIYPKDKKSLASLTSLQTVQDLLREDFPRFLPFAEELTEQLISNPVGGFVTIHTDPWYYKDFMAVVGDAAHGFYPFFGQGTSAAFGDGMQLVNLIDKYGPDWGKIFPLYQASRKRHMDALGELSKEGLMRYARNKRADFESIYDQLEFIGHKFLPKYIHPPLTSPVMNDPEHTADYVENTKRQRKKAKRVGIPLAIAMLTKVVAVYERIQNSRARSS